MTRRSRSFAQNTATHAIRATTIAAGIRQPPGSWGVQAITPMTAINTSDATPRMRSTATDARASLGLVAWGLGLGESGSGSAVTRVKPYARTASAPMPAGRKLPTNELIRNNRVAPAVEI